MTQHAEELLAAPAGDPAPMPPPVRPFPTAWRYPSLAGRGPQVRTCLDRPARGRKVRRHSCTGRRDTPPWALRHVGVNSWYVLKRPTVSGRVPRRLRSTKQPKNACATAYRACQRIHAQSIASMHGRQTRRGRCAQGVTKYYRHASKPQLIISVHDSNLSDKLCTLC